MLYQSDEDRERSGDRPTHIELQEYHDFIEVMIESGFWATRDHMTQQAMVVCRDTLCYVLGHENKVLAENIQMWAEQYHKFAGISDQFPN